MPMTLRGFRCAFVIVCLFGAAACGGDDKEDDDDDDNDSGTSASEICNDVADAIYDCESSIDCGELNPRATFVASCTDDPPTPAERDTLVALSCSEIAAELCGGGGGAVSECPGTQVCADLGNAGVCVVSIDGEGNVSIPNDADECTSGGASCPDGYGCVTNGDSTDGVCLLICEP